MMFVSAQTLSGGRAPGVAAALGVGAGAVLHAAFAALGLAALMAAHPFAFELIRYAGAAYLLFMAIQMIRTQPNLSAAEDVAPRGLRRAFRQGLLTNLLNPKVIVFVLAFLPQFANPAVGPVGMQIFLLGTLFAATGTSVLVAVAMAGGRLRTLIGHHPQAGRIIGWISGTLIGGLAIGLLLTSRKAA
jgi:threonine/homoserine/homoserine lactone efflux protein